MRAASKIYPRGNVFLMGIIETNLADTSKKSNCEIISCDLMVFCPSVVATCNLQPTGIHNLPPKFAIISTEPSVGAVVPRKDGGILVAAAHHFSFLDEDTGELSRIKEISAQFPESRFNDGKCDPAGRFWAGEIGLNL